jgi:PAS domain S-box-containing protein
VKKPIKFLYWAGSLALMILGINLGIVFLVHNQELRASLSDTISPIVDLLASVALFVAAKNSTPRSKHLARAWGWIALATFLYALGDIIWLILEVVLKTPPFPSIADGFYLAYYPVSLVGVFLLMDKSASTGERINRGLDIGIIFGAAILGFWNFLIGPIIISNVGEPLLEQAILMAYPVGDLVLCGALLLIIYNRSDEQNQTPIFFLFGSLLITIIADSIYSYQSLLGIYVSGGLLDLGWIVSTLLMGLAGVAQFVAVRSTKIPKKSSPEFVLQGKLSPISLYLPYFWLVGAYVVLVIGGMTPLPMSFLSLSIGVGTIIGLVLVRQVITLSENKKLNDQLQTTMGRYQTQSAELEKANQELRIDITERKHAQEALLESEKRFRALVEHSLEEISLIDPDGTLTYESPTERRPLGYPPNSFVGHNLFDLFPPDEQAAAASLLEEVVKHPGSSQEALFRLRHQDGSWRWMEGVMTNLLDEPAVQSVVINYRDITERKRAEQEIASMAKFPSENPNPVMRLSRDGSLLYANTASAALLRMWECEVGQPAPQYWRELVAQVIDSKENQTVDIECEKKVYEIIVARVPEASYVNVYGRDLTERKLAEAELIQSEALFRALFELSPDSIVVIDPHDAKDSWPIIDCNKAACQISGFGRDELIGQSIDILNATPGTLPERTAYRSQLREAGNLHYEVAHRHKDGSVFPVEVSTAIFTVSGRELVLGIDRDISERKRTELSLRTSEEKYRDLVNEANDGVFAGDDHGVLTFANQALARIHGVEHPEELLGRTFTDFIAPAMVENITQLFRKSIQGEVISETIEAEIIRPDGTGAFIEIKPVPIVENGTVTGIRGVVRDVTARKQAEEAIRETEARFEGIVNMAVEAIISIDENQRVILFNQGAERIFGYTAAEAVGMPLVEFLPPASSDKHEFLFQNFGATADEQSRRMSKLEEIQGQRRGGELFPAEVNISKMTVKGKMIYTAIVRDVTARKQSEKEIKISNDELSMLFELSHSLAETDSLENILELVNRHAVESIHITFARIALLEAEKFSIRAAYPIRFIKHDLGIGECSQLADLPYSKRVLEQNEPTILRASDPGIRNEEKKALLLDFAQSVCLVPLRISDSASTTGKLMGLLMLGEVRSESREPFTLRKLRLAQTIGDSAAIAIRRMLLREQTERRLQQLTALSNIDRAISSTFDLELSLGMLLQQVSMLLGVDATDVLLFNPNSLTLEYSAGRGFRTKSFEHAQLRLGEGYAGQAALNRETVQILDLAAQHNNPRLEKHLADEQFVSYYGVPLISRGQIMGVLEIFQRAELEPDEEWLSFLSTLAGQAAIAIDSVMQFEHVQRSNNELSQAYDETIEGWSHALDLRDKETEGHTQRVTELTVQLGRHFGLSEEDLVQVRRGALLHDIGKMGVPDGILLKPGPLTDEEWVTMRRHPTFAYEMLSPIHYLRAAIDIPYCHHEKWDGNGYPRGLRGEQIPLAARIFAVVDVWDALTSDRVYRAAWPKEKVLEHIRSLAGTHFDPQVAKVCLESGLLEG